MLVLGTVAACRARTGAKEYRSTMPESLKLLSSQRFRPFFVTQLLGAFNDNLYKNGLTVLIAFQATSISQQHSNLLVNVAAGLYCQTIPLTKAPNAPPAPKQRPL